MAELKTQVEKAAISPMLTEGISKSYRSGIDGRRAQSCVETVAQTASNGAEELVCSAGGDANQRQGFVARAGIGDGGVRIEHARDPLREPRGGVEAGTIAGRATDRDIHGSEADLAAFGDLIAILERKAGRLIVNGFPTGVEVCHAMVHGGPYPATSDSRATSVGTYSIYRFVRPVCFQDFPRAALPEELKNENPLGIWRLIDGQFTQDAVRAGSTAGRKHNRTSNDQRDRHGENPARALPVSACNQPTSQVPANPPSAPQLLTSAITSPTTLRGSISGMMAKKGP